MLGRAMHSLMHVSISPQRISWISLMLSIVAFFMLRANLLYGMMWIAMVLIVDTGDGLLFKRRHLTKLDGLGIEVSHRLSEFLLFYPNRIWILLATLNVYLTIAKLKEKKIIVLPLRHVFLAALILEFFGILPLILSDFV